jgi:hypothetical protein
MTERLYPLVPTPAVDAAEGHFEPEEDGGFDFPGPVAERLHSARYGKRKLWETAIERQERTHGDDLARRRDPAVLYDAVDNFAGLVRMLGTAAAPQDPEAEKAALRARLAELEAAGDGGEAAGTTAASRRRPAPAK